MSFYCLTVRSTDFRLKPSRKPCGIQKLNLVAENLIIALNLFYFTAYKAVLEGRGFSLIF
ncbi:hypothetical protein AWQ21_04670 [Picosynechococcus sp. PCC 7003]|nr:hypothetical protein AWQ21_04670 [Picosynechococcus sp. PCC 7003]